MLAWLRAHYPEHQHKRKRKRKRKREDKRRDHTPSPPPPFHNTQHTTHNTQRVDSEQQAPHALLPNTNHHRYSKMTQPCHKDTALNQQCCDSEHKDREHREENGDNTRQGGQHNTRTPPPFNRTTTQTKGGTPHTRRGGQQHSRPSLTMPPHHPPCHPTIHDGPTLHHDEGGADRGYPTTRTAHRDTHPHHATHLARNSARHDSSTCQHCSGMSGARATPPHRAGQQQHTPPPFHTPRRMDTIHPSTHLLSLIHVRTTNERS